MSLTIYVTPPWVPRFLVVRHPLVQRHFFDVILHWVESSFPELLPLFEVHELPCHIPWWSNYRLHLPWLQDPVQQWSMEAYDQANLLAAKCDEHGIPIINRVDRLINATKSVGARMMAGVGVRTPRMALIRNVEEFKETRLGISLPLFVREDWGHAGTFCRADSHEEVRAIPVERFIRPVVVELIDVRDRHDGLYRKYRCIAAGRRGVSHHLQIAREWVTCGENRIYSDATRAEELSYVNKPDPNHEVLQRARAALGLDFVAFDYAYDHDGRLIVWEANPFPFIHFSEGRLNYLQPNVHKTLRAILGMNLDAASLPIPDRLVMELGD